MEFDFKNLSSEQEEVLKEILRVCRYLHQSRGWNLSDDLLAQQAREIAWKMELLNRLSQ